MELPQDGRRRALIEEVRPAVDCGRSALKRALGESIIVERLQFRSIDNDQLVCYSKHSADGANVILVVVNLDPLHAQSGFIDMPLEEWALDASAPYQADEQLSGSRYQWQGRRVFVTLTPSECPACVYRVHARRSVSERDFDYFV